MTGRDTETRVVGVDVGSTHVKAAVVGLDGHVMAVSRRSTPTRPEGTAGAVHPVDDLIASIEGVVRDAVAGAGGDGVGAVGIASVAEAGAPVDHDGRPLHDVIAWYDRRSGDAARRLAERVPPADLFARTGLRSDAKVTLAKLLWLRERDAGLVERMAGWRFVADLVAGTWTGAVGTSVTLACRSMAWNLHRGAWDPELLALAGVRLDQVPPVVPWTEPVGRLRPSVAARLGLTAGIPVAVAGHDHLVGALAAGVIEPGDALDSIGTAEAVLLVTGAPALDEQVRAAGFSVGAHVLPRRFTLIGAIQTSGAFVDWFLAAVAGVAPDASPAERYRRLNELARAARRQPSGIVARPTLRGRTAPQPDQDAAASFEGLSLADGLPELALAALEGTAFHARSLKDELERIGGHQIRCLRTIGGGTDNETLVEIKTALSPEPIEVVDLPEAVAVGAGRIAGVAAGLIGAAAVTTPIVPVRPIPEPSPELRAAYEDVYRRAFFRTPTGPAASGAS